MLLMLKLFLITLLLGSVSLAGSLDEKVEKFLSKALSGNKRLTNLQVKVVDRFDVKNLEDWDAMVVQVEATLKEKSKSRKVRQKMIWFTDGNVITKDLVDMNTGKDLRDMINPSFKPEYYKKHNLIYGNEKAKHKVAIFSDPVCPFCKQFVPQAIEYMKKRPDEFAIYYYNFPLENIHPSALTLVKAAIAAELKGEKNVTLKLYKLKISSREKSIKKILKAFNKVMKTDITEKDLKSKAVLERVKYDIFVAEELMVGGTPTMFFDGKIDKTKQKFKQVK